MIEAVFTKQERVTITPTMDELRLSLPDWIPATFVKLTLDLHGESARDWLMNLPNRIDNYAGKWSLQVLPPFANLSYNYVAPAIRSDGTDVVLKMGVPGPELRREVRALEVYRGQGAVGLLEKDVEHGVFLLERLRPGSMLAELHDDDHATRIAARLMRQLWRPLPERHPFRNVAEWAQGLGRLRQEFEGGSGPFPEYLVAMAESIFAQLFASAGEPVLLHGDFHHFNILSSERSPWLAIDPKGVFGDPAYDVGALLHNPWDEMTKWQDAGLLFRRRVAILAEALEFDRQRIAAHGFAQAVLSGWWLYEDFGRGWEPVIGLAEQMAKEL